MTKIYLVRWPSASVSLVTAHDEAQLFQTVVANSGENAHCTFEEYMGENLFLTFTPQPSVIKKKSPLIATCEAPETQEEALKDYRALYHSKLYADVEFRVEGRIITCHRAILAQRCKYFQAMFDSNMKEASQKVIDLSGFSFPIMEAIIKFLYTGILDVPCDKNFSEKENCGQLHPEALKDYMIDTKFPFLIEVLKASDFYSLTSLHKLCLSELQNIMKSEKLTMELACEIFEVGTKFENDCLRDHACMAIGKELSRCMIFNEDASERFSQLPTELRHHLRHIWETKLEQNPIYFGKDRELMDCLTISTPPEEKFVETVKQLIAEGANPSNIHALHVLTQHWSINTSDQNQIFSDLARVLIESGCKINARDGSGHTAMHVAARHGRHGQVAALLALGAAPYRRCRPHARTALAEAAHGFDERTAALLLAPNLPPIPQHYPPLQPPPPNPQNPHDPLDSPLSPCSAATRRAVALKHSAYLACRETCKMLARAMAHAQMRRRGAGRGKGAGQGVKQGAGGGAGAGQGVRQGADGQGDGARASSSAVTEAMNNHSQPTSSSSEASAIPSSSSASASASTQNHKRTHTRASPSLSVFCPCATRSTKHLNQPHCNCTTTQPPPNNTNSANNASSAHNCNDSSSDDDDDDDNNPFDNNEDDNDDNGNDTSDDDDYYADDDNDTLNAYFIDRLFTAQGLDVNARVQFDTTNLGVHRRDFDETLLEFVLPRFAATWDQIQRRVVDALPVDTEEAKQKLRCALLADYRDAKTIHSSGDKLASLQRLKTQGRFSDLPAESWIHEYDLIQMLNLERTCTLFPWLVPQH